jgi:hypothetical protein
VRVGQLCNRGQNKNIKKNGAFSSKKKKFWENFEVNRKQQFAQVYLHIRIQENIKNLSTFSIFKKKESSRLGWGENWQPGKNFSIPSDSHVKFAHV